MKNSVAIAVMAVVAVAIMIVPAVNASSVTVVLSPESDSATVSAYFNSTLTVNVSGSYHLPSFLLNLISEIMPDNFSSHGYISGSSSAFQLMNASLQNRDSNAVLQSLSYSLVSNVSKSTSARYEVMVISTSAELAMNVSGIFSNKTANLSWRSFQVTGNLDLGGSYSNIVTINNSALNVFNLSAFQVSLKKWNRTYDAAANTTTFSYNAGTTLNYSFSAKNGDWNVSLVIDPSYTISTPGYATVSSANSVNITSPPRQSSDAYYVIATILVIGAAVSFYFARRRR